MKGIAFGNSLGKVFSGDKSILFVLATVIFTFSVMASSTTDLGKPEPEEVYGGRINWIDPVATSASNTRLFISTESANSMFYADVDHSSTPPTFGTFQAVPDMDDDNDYGANIRNFAADGASGFVFVVYEKQLLSCSTTASSLTQVAASDVIAVAVENSNLFYLTDDAKDIKLNFGAINSSTGAFTADANSPLTVVSGLAPSGELRMMISPSNSKIYIAMEGTPPTLYRSSDAYNALSSTSTFSALTVSSLGTTQEYRGFGIGPDGRLFLGGVASVEPNHEKCIAYSDADGDPWTSFTTGVGGTSGPNIACSGDSTSYYVFFGSAVSTNKGISGSWVGMPNGGTDDTHPNDGVVRGDPNAVGTIYLTTDIGIGASTDYCANIQDIEDGVEAVQVNDFDMNSAKTIAWTASKSGIRQVTGYATASETWTVSFPNDDGSPYYSIAMDKSVTSGNTAYAANLRLYKTTDGGSNWTRLFTVEDYPSDFDFWSHIPAIVVSENDPNVVFIGINSPTSGVKGAIYYSLDATAASPTFTKLDTGVYNPEVKDLLLVEISGGTTGIVYVACEYVSDGTTSSYGVKTVSFDTSSSSVTFSNDMVSVNTGGSITNFGANDQAINLVTGDIYAAGTNSSGEPRVYIMASGTTTWDSLATSGLPSTGQVAAITIGEDASGNKIPYIAIEESIYTFDGSSWTLQYTYAIGNKINVLYWDELLVGTGTGLYGQDLTGGTATAQVSIGSVFDLAVTSLGKDADGNAFADDKFFKKPKITATYYDPVKDVDKEKLKKAPVKVTTKVCPINGIASVRCAWTKKISLLNKKKIPKDETAKEYLLGNQAAYLTCNTEVKVKDSTGNKGPFTGLTLNLMPPAITDVQNENGSQTITSAAAGAKIIIKGTFFGVKKPKVWLEYLKNGQVKAKACKVEKDGFIYEDVNGKDSAMDVTSGTGASQITISLPKKFPKDWDHTLNHNIVIDNKIGRATIDFKTTE